MTKQSHMLDYWLVVSDLEQGKRWYRTTPKGDEYLSAFDSMCALLQTETRRSQI